ncbi:hypothetical protein HPB47_019055 [Ixodes persulcatus]|uniref:Uncharacterized protein n=1 Tax=Ixodes persulcatus TaxID=34615 RepID=A0AC60QZR3_IXOPE|nr:hypothetical protein HPB47_019055 [Ixodes persulcatus]
MPQTHQPRLTPRILLVVTDAVRKDKVRPWNLLSSVRDHIVAAFFRRRGASDEVQGCPVWEVSLRPRRTKVAQPAAGPFTVHERWPASGRRNDGGTSSARGSPDRDPHLKASACCSQATLPPPHDGCERNGISSEQQCRQTGQAGKRSLRLSVPPATLTRSSDPRAAATSPRTRSAGGRPRGEAAQGTGSHEPFTPAKADAPAASAGSPRHACRSPVRQRTLLSPSDADSAKDGPVRHFRRHVA